ncbi:hypothetical protein [Polyangium aurulentum]|uniref:hypothetical protein n=1 Tax=Polyangium aurulentum TaxID=2567896 RepID=UPI0010ADB4D5|nr:hypothetical protein [Polyangium aurulentum]UQA60387.1 hypothetical protein E8A73_007910 [Polyangium aurulentum]
MKKMRWRMIGRSSLSQIFRVTWVVEHDGVGGIGPTSDKVANAIVHVNGIGRFWQASVKCGRRGRIRGPNQVQFEPWRLGAGGALYYDPGHEQCAFERVKLKSCVARKNERFARGATTG